MNPLPQIMGILNVTPDSFSDGGRFLQKDLAIKQAQKMMHEGATIIDVGGESTRPGSAPITIDEELNRVIPIIEFLRGFNTTISIDSRHPEVMHQAVKAGATIINDISGMREAQARAIAAEYNCEVVIMHMQGTPQTMQQNPQYEDAVQDVYNFLLAQAQLCEDAGVKKEKIIIDPGIGFGKTLEHNIALLKAIPVFKASGYRVLIGASRKSFIGKIDANAAKPEDRLSGSLAAAIHATQMGADILRVHDVRETLQALQVYFELN